MDLFCISQWLWGVRVCLGGGGSFFCFFVLVCGCVYVGFLFLVCRVCVCFVLFCFWYLYVFPGCYNVHECNLCGHSDDMCVVKGWRVNFYTIFVLMIGFGRPTGDNFSSPLPLWTWRERFTMLLFGCYVVNIRTRVPNIFFQSFTIVILMTNLESWKLLRGLC